MLHGLATRGIPVVVHEALDQRPLLLASLPPSRLQNRLACGIVVTMLVLFVVTLRYVNVQLPRVDAFIPIHAITTLINDLITAILLFSQYSIERRRTLLVLASGYLFTALIVIPWALTFPGLFAPTGLLGPGLQTTAWLYTSWHIGSPLILIVAVLLKDTESKQSESGRSPIATVGLSIAVATATVCAVVCGLTWITIAGERLLPTIVLPDGIHLNQSVASSLSGLIMVLAGGALALLWIRRRSVLDLWLMVVCCAWLLETATATLFVGARYQLGWYAGRSFGIAATFVVLLVLLSETLILYASLARSIMRQRNERHARQIAMDAMAASIAHEIRQPLASIALNGETALHCLTGATSDLDEARDALRCVVDDSHRASAVISGIRSMFQKGAHGQILLDVNDLVRETLTMVDLDLRTYGISVKTDLHNGVLQLSGDRGQLQQVFLNLISNAIEAMNSVTDRARNLQVRTDQKSSHIVVTVEDSGTGLEGEDKDRIFEPFFTTKSTGTGVGLTICRVI
ncbi:MAG TPA: MASE4 domain-containing protein, partial [Candidatus Acidoferrum sp.]|nr:MASE4 domain-containing protein [Candidatus Acidoferrum sp.]